MLEIANYGITGLFFISVIEAIFFPIPPDTLLIPLVLNTPASALILALTATTGSLCGAVIGYFIGHKGGRFVTEKLFSPENIKKAEDILAKYDVWAVILAGFTPIPYKVFTILSGILRMNFSHFMFASIIGRGGRFFLLAILVAMYNEEILGFINNYFGILSIVIVLAAAVAYWLYKKLRKSFQQKP